VARQDLYDFGEPPCLVKAEVGGIFVASDPPVSLQFFDEGEDLATTVGGVGDWVEVPAQACGTVKDFIGWARAHVGTEGRPVSAARRPLRGEVDDEPPEIYEQRFIGWPYRLARRPTIRIILETRTPLGRFAGPLRTWLDLLRASLLVPLVDAYRERGGTASSSPYGTWGAPNEMLTSVTSPRGDDEDSDTVDVASDEWHRVASLLMERRDVYVTVEICDPLGFAAMGYRWGKARVNLTAGPHGLLTAELEASEPMIALLGNADPIVDLVVAGINDLGMSLCEASVGRTLRRDRWISVTPAVVVQSEAASSQPGAADSFERVVALRDGATLLLATCDSAAYTAERAGAVSTVLDELRS
jgi:hypothetical protein